MSKKIYIYLLLIGTGLIILAWPEQDNLMLVRFSETHGPSWLDSIGILIIMLGYLPMVFKVITRLRPIKVVIGKFKCTLLILISAFFFALIPLALYYSIEALLWISIFISTLSQAILIYYSFSISAEI